MISFTSRPLYDLTKDPSTTLKWRLRETRAGLITFGKRNVRDFCNESNHDSSVVQPSDSNRRTIPIPGMSAD